MRSLVAATVALLIGVSAAACAPPGAGGPPAASGAPVARDPGVGAPSATGSPPAPSSTARATAAKPAFLTARLTDVRTGEAFALGGFPGKVMLVQAMAVW